MWHQLQGRKSTGHSSEANIFLFVIVMSGTSFPFSNVLGTVMLNSLIYFSLLSWCRRNNFTRYQWQHLRTWHIESPSCWPHRHKHSGIVPQQVRLKLVSFIFIKFLFFHQMISLKKLWKMLLISSKKLISFYRPSLFFSLSAIALEDDRR